MKMTVEKIKTNFFRLQENESGVEDIAPEELEVEGDDVEEENEE